MPVTPSYPGIYIQELQSSTHTITASPTNIAVFVGYSHPLKTITFNKAIELFSFSDYEANFGGLFNSTSVSTDLAYSVYQFFLNGGTNAYVVGLQVSGAGAITPATAVSAEKIAFQAREIATADNPIVVTIDNIQASVAGGALDTADIVITYGSSAETYRKVSLNATSGKSANPNFIGNRLGTSGNPVSSFVKLADAQPSPFPAAFKSATKQSLTLPAPSPAPAAAAAAAAAPAPAPAPPPVPAGPAFSAQDFLNVFAQDSSLDQLPIFNLLIIPGVTDNGVLSEALSFAERKQAFVIIDPPADRIANQAGPLWIGDYIEGLNGQTEPPKSPNGALYFPYLKSSDPISGNTISVPPSGYVAGIYCKTDDDRGVWKAPAGLETIISNTLGVVETGAMNDLRQGSLNPLGVNVLRQFPGIGTVVYGARTLVTQNVAFQQWKYVPVRRTALFIEQTLYRNLGWVVFEPNDTPLWVSIRTSIEAFLLGLFHQGAFQGDTPSQAFQVKVDSTTTSQADIDNGIVNIIVAFAPLKPAEFVVVKIAQLAGQTQS
jgi:phage tail sheath protein FI